MGTRALTWNLLLSSLCGATVASADKAPSRCRITFQRHRAAPQESCASSRWPRRGSRAARLAARVALGVAPDGASQVRRPKGQHEQLRRRARLPASCGQAHFRGCRGRGRSDPALASLRGDRTVDSAAVGGADPSAGPLRAPRLHLVDLGLLRGDDARGEIPDLGMLGRGERPRRHVDGSFVVRDHGVDEAAIERHR